MAKRLDNLERIKDRRGKDEHVIKCCLKKRLKEPFLEEIRRWVLNTSKIIHRGSLIFNQFLLHCLDDNIDLPKFDLAFFTQCFKIGIAEFHRSVKEWLENSYTRGF